MAVGRIRVGFLLAFLLLSLAVLLPVVIRSSVRDEGPSVTIESVEGRARRITLSEMKRMPTVSRRGMYQNQYGNWRDEGVYVGVPLTAILGENESYRTLLICAEDGYEVPMERHRVESADYPVILAYAFEGEEVPLWVDGFRIAVLPEDGSVSNEEYEAVSAGGYWVKNVARIVLQLGPTDGTAQ
jgi:hypothetical protein